MTDARIRGESAVATPASTGQLRRRSVARRAGLCGLVPSLLLARRACAARSWRNSLPSPNRPPARGGGTARVARIRRPERSRGRKDRFVPDRAISRARSSPRLFDGEYVQPIPGKEPGTVQGRNVGALLRGSDAQLARRVGDRGGPFRSSGRAPGRALSRVPTTMPRASP